MHVLTQKEHIAVRSCREMDSEAGSIASRALLVVFKEKAEAGSVASRTLLVVLRRKLLKLVL